ncbi:MAG TPA: hypothetical protein VGK49_07025, partial [Ilumatobacteraceae bacterium]
MHEAGGALRALLSVLRRLANALRTPPWRRRALTALGCVAAFVLLAMAGSGYDMPDRIASPTSTTSTTSTTQPVTAEAAMPSTTAGTHATGSERSTRVQLATLPATSTSIADTTPTTVAITPE